MKCKNCLKIIDCVHMGLDSFSSEYFWYFLLFLRSCERDSRKYPLKITTPIIFYYFSQTKVFKSHENVTVSNFSGKSICFPYNPHNFWHIDCVRYKQSKKNWVFEETVTTRIFTFPCVWIEQHLHVQEQSSFFKTVLVFC